MSVTVTGTAKGGLEVKRLRLPGLLLSAPCPGCGKVIEQDLGSNYLAYPEVGKPVKHSFYHGDCAKPTSQYGDTEWSEWVQYDITVTPVEAPGAPKKCLRCGHLVVDIGTRDLCLCWGLGEKPPAFKPEDV